eukprot:scaffold10_cov257-Pinguiococcus_pyrenoidosus.AAC.40
MAAPQLSPAPKPAHAMTSPFFTLPLATASARASGMEAAEPIRHGFHDADVGLVQQEPVYLLHGDVRVPQRFVEDLRHARHGEAVDLPAVHLDGVVASPHHARALRRGQVPRFPLEQQVQLVVAAPVRVHGEAQDAALAFRLGRPQDHRSGAVAEEDAGVSVVPIHPAAKRIRADHKGAAKGAIVQELRRGHRPEQEAGARSREVKGHRVARAEVPGHRGRVAKEVIWTGRAKDHQVQVRGIALGSF